LKIEDCRLKIEDYRLQIEDEGTLKNLKPGNIFFVHEEKSRHEKSNDIIILTDKHLCQRPAIRITCPISPGTAGATYPVHSFLQ
jgi:hypothetical protein